MAFRSRLAAPVAFLVLLFAAVPGFADLLTFDKGTLSIDTAKGTRQFSIEIARDEAHREQGLMFRQSMPEDAGMLFLFGQAQITDFWMKNTLIPLDMLFVGADGHIVNIYKRAVPMSEAIIASAGPVVAVIELNGGAADKFGIKPGDLVHAPGIDE
jgi:uncharacterized membrane protein (UPF0127 family)